jgi:hypothetical protein
VPNRDPSGAKSTPVVLQTYAQFQATVSSRRADIAKDFEAKRQKDLQDRRIYLQELSLQLAAAEVSQAEGDREFLTKKESLVTSLHRIEGEAEVRFAQAQLVHMNEKEAIQMEHNRQLQRLTEALPKMMAKASPLEQDSPFGASVSKPPHLHRSKSTLEDLDDSDESDMMYSMRITTLESQKRELLQATRDEKQNGESRIQELTLMLEDEENDRKAELDTLQHTMEKQEETAKKTISRLYADLEAAQQKRQKVVQAHKAKIEDLERKIDAVDREFSVKLSEANKVTETLKTRLVNANMRKNQHLEMERQRSSQQQRLLQETYSLHQEVFDMQKRVNNAREESGILRRELSTCVGPRRTASLFM